MEELIYDGWQRGRRKEEIEKRAWMVGRRKKMKAKGAFKQKNKKIHVFNWKKGYFGQLQ